MSECVWNESLSRDWGSADIPWGVYIWVSLPWGVILTRDGGPGRGSLGDPETPLPEGVPGRPILGPPGSPGDPGGAHFRGYLITLPFGTNRNSDFFTFLDILAISTPLKRAIFRLQTWRKKPPKRPKTPYRPEPRPPPPSPAPRGGPIRGGPFLGLPGAPGGPQKGPQKGPKMAPKMTPKKGLFSTPKTPPRKTPQGPPPGGSSPPLIRATRPRLLSSSEQRDTNCSVHPSNATPTAMFIRTK